MAITNLTKRITAGAAIYLKNSGFKPVEPEVLVADGWVADLAGFIKPTQTELIRHLKLDRVLGYEPRGSDINWSQWFKFHYGWLFTGIVEVKISKSDFRKDLVRKFSKPGPAHFCWLAYPRGVIPENSPNTFFYYWGRLEFSSNGNRLLEVKPPLIFPQNPGDVTNLIANVAERCYNRRGYREMRQHIKEFQNLEA